MSPAAEVRILLLFPGQGSQSVGMCSWLGDYPVAVDLFKRAEAVLGWNVWDVCERGPLEILTRTDIAQPAIFVASLATWAVLTELLGPASVPPGAALQFVALGHSLGEYAVLAACGYMGFEAALAVVRERGLAMRECGEAQGGGMVAVLGLKDEQVARLAAEVGDAWPANFNCDGQVVVSGTDAALRLLKERVATAGGKAVSLRVSGAFHSPLVAAATQRVAAALERVPLAASPVGTFFSSSELRSVAPSDVPTVMVRQLVSPVRFADAVRAVRPLVRVAVEVGPGRVLSGLIKRIDPELPVFSTDSLPAMQRTETALRDALGG